MIGHRNFPMSLFSDLTPAGLMLPMVPAKSFLLERIKPSKRRAELTEAEMWPMKVLARWLRLLVCRVPKRKN
jgi:hypothetical protein